jgi:hypothetical protein
MYYFVTFLFLLLSAKTSLFYSNIGYILTDLVLIWVGIEKKRFCARDFKIILISSSIYIVYCTVRWMFLLHLPVSFWSSDIDFLTKFIFTSFLFCAVLKDHAIHYLVKVIYHLAIISIPLYFLQLVGGDLYVTLGNALHLTSDLVQSPYTNFFVFSYAPEHAIRNSGFCWEPGAFGFYLNMALMLNFLINKFSFDKKTGWLAFAIVTTLSTTSYLALAIIVIAYLRANGMKLNKLIIISVPVLCFLGLQVPFLVSKISLIYSKDSEMMNRISFLSKYYYKRGLQLPLNRFGSMFYLYQLFGINLVWGISNDYIDSVPALKSINISNGIFEMMAQFGLISLIYLLNRIYALVKKLTASIETSLYCVAVILVLGFSEPIFSMSLMVSFFFLYYYSTPAEINEEPVLMVWDEEYDDMLIQPLNSKHENDSANKYL